MGAGVCEGAVGTLSVVVPCYDEEEALPIFAAELFRVAGEMSESDGVAFEFVFVDDGSRDGTLGLLRSYAAADPRVRYVSFSRNFGKEAALYAGLEAATGDWVATMDADMQDPPSLLPEMWAAVASGEWDSAATRRADRRGEPPLRSLCARLFYRVMNRLSDAEIMDGARDFRLMDRRVADAVLSLGERNRFSKGIYGWVGFRTRWFSYENVGRAAGGTKWSFWRLARYAAQGVVSFSTGLLSAASALGLAACAASLVAVVAIVVKTLLFGDPVGGWPSLACIVVFMGGLQLLCTGLLGQYVSRTYVEAKRRPLYVVAETEGGPARGRARG